ncbi:hypothetical protein PGQ11_002380 [Apiospora arundinis]|uniref:Uncharacterized protein n=1 Tax=Apiospora arundinis TaxID=335852 RepID=A0ABR2JI31_9PEZI
MSPSDIVTHVLPQQAVSDKNSNLVSVEQSNITPGTTPVNAKAPTGKTIMGIVKTLIVDQTSSGTQVTRSTQEKETIFEHNKNTKTKGAGRTKGTS